MRWPLLSRAPIFALAVSSLACANDGDRGHGRERGQEPGDDSPARPHTSSSSGAPILSRGADPGARAPVAVVRIDPAQTRPCERLCGGLGDCLLEEGQYEDLYGKGAATHLEFECLDLCVHAPTDAPAHSDFLACGQQDACPELTHCVAESWEPLRASHQRPATAEVEIVQNGCRSGCEWLYYCLFTQAPPGEKTLSPELIENMESCFEQCEYAGPEASEHLITMAECLHQHCSTDANECLR